MCKENCVKCALLSRDIAYNGKLSPTFRDVMSGPSSRGGIDRFFSRNVGK